MSPVFCRSYLNAVGSSVFLAYLARLMHLHIINGPNLNLLGKRETALYGQRSFDDYLTELRQIFPHLHLSYFQSNHEGALIDYLHQIGFDPTTKGIVFNPGAYTHSSIALRDAVAALPVPVIEVHISNIFAREKFRHHSYISPAARGIISGLGLPGYRLALQYLIDVTQ